ncbi:MAG: ThiF family adenylyltransferase [bacterium]|nr:ThiF family adenylyltransferase [bacterium]
MIYHAALTTAVHEKLKNFLVRQDGQEDLCFGLWHPSTGKERMTALIYKVILPGENERKVHGNVSFMPNYFDRVIGLALEENAGVAFMHSHPYPGWQSTSTVDEESENRMAAPVYAATNLPLVGLTIGNNEIWSARFWRKKSYKNYKIKWCEAVRVVGDALAVNYNDNLLPPSEFNEELKRTFSAWGNKKQSDLMRLKIGIVGLGSVGSIIAESLARMGISKIKLIDYDYIQKKNLDRCLHATRKDIGKLKIDVVAKSIKESATSNNFQVNKINASIVEKTGLEEALDCDILFSCVDKPWARQVLNLIAYAHLIPVIDGGIIVNTNKNKTNLIGADWKAHVVGPGRKCLECLRQYNSSLATAEKNGSFVDPVYIKSLDENHPIKRNENVFVFSLSLASLEMMQMLSLVIYPCQVPAQHNYHFTTGTMNLNNDRGCNDDCIFTQVVAKGDNSGFDLTGTDLKAEKIRRKNSEKKNIFISILNHFGLNF